MADIVQKRFFSLGAGKVKRVLLSLSTVATNFHPSIFLVAHFITSVICGSSSARAPFFFFSRGHASPCSCFPASMCTLCNTTNTRIRTVPYTGAKGECGYSYSRNSQVCWRTKSRCLLVGGQRRVDFQALLRIIAGAVWRARLATCPVPYQYNALVRNNCVQ